MTKKTPLIPVSQMTMQDVFAGLVMGGLVAAHRGPMKAAVLAQNAYALADVLVGEWQARQAATATATEPITSERAAEVLRQMEELGPDGIKTLEEAEAKGKPHK